LGRAGVLKDLRLRRPPRRHCQPANRPAPGRSPRDDAGRLGAQDITDWAKAHRGRIEIAPTKAYEIFDAARATTPNLRQPDLGERAAVEAIGEPDRLLGDERGVLLCEETAVLKRVVVRDRERIVELSTLDFLRILEAEHASNPPNRCSNSPRRPGGSRLAPRK